MRGKYVFCCSICTNFNLTSHLKVRMQCFTEKFPKKNFFWYSYFFWKDLSGEYLVVSKLLLKVSEFKKNVLICINTIIKVNGVLLTLLQVKTILSA